MSSTLARLADLVVALPADRRVRVAIDGVDGSGKTTLAESLADAVAARRAVVRASVDAFHRPRAERYRRGADSAEGCYCDTFDLDALRSRLLEPFVRDGRYVTAVFDHLRDEPVAALQRQAPPGAVLLVDGVHLQRPALAGCWDLVVYLQVPDDEVLRRVAVRDAGAPADVVARYRSRYLPAQRLYEAECRPAERADVVLDNTDPGAPVVLRLPAAGRHTRGMPLKEKPWFPYVSATAWALAVLALVLVNSGGNVVLAVALAAVVAVLSWRIDGARRKDRPSRDRS